MLLAYDRPEVLYCQLLALVTSTSKTGSGFSGVEWRFVLIRLSQPVRPLHGSSERGSVFLAGAGGSGLALVWHDDVVYAPLVRCIGDVFLAAAAGAGCGASAGLPTSTV